MKKYILILFATILFCSCTEDNTVDITVMPTVTTTGENTFGCLVDGWVYVGGRYLGWGHSTLWTHDSFIYDEQEDKLNVSLQVKPGVSISFVIISPQEGKEATITHLRFGEEELEDGIASITRFDTKKKIISATFGNDSRLTNGRFDVHYATQRSEE